MDPIILRNEFRFRGFVGMETQIQERIQPLAAETDSAGTTQLFSQIQGGEEGLPKV